MMKKLNFSHAREQDAISKPLRSSIRAPLAPLNLSRSDHHSEAAIPTKLRKEKWIFPAEIELVDHIVPQ